MRAFHLSRLLGPVRCFSVVCIWRRLMTKESNCTKTKPPSASTSINNHLGAALGLLPSHIPVLTGAGLLPRPLHCTPLCVSEGFVSFPTSYHHRCRIPLYRVLHLRYPRASSLVCRTDACIIASISCACLLLAPACYSLSHAPLDSTDGLEQCIITTPVHNTAP